MKNYHVSEYLHFQPIENDIGVGWNRFYPSIFIINDTARGILEDIRQGKELPVDPQVDAFMEKLLEYKFIYDAPSDPSRAEFFTMVDALLLQAKNHLETFHQQKKKYDSLTIINDECNLRCPYCVNEHKEKMRRTTAAHSNTKTKTCRHCIDLFLAEWKGDEKDQPEVFFNGGEILLEWPLLKELVEYMSAKYGHLKIKFGINTNMTLMTDEIAEFLTRHKFKVEISIDGYKENHNRTRIYSNKKGSFDDILRGLEIYRKYENGLPIQQFQGTVHAVADFDAEKVYGLEAHGLYRARLAPNLLNTTPDDAIKKAHMVMNFLELNKNHTLQVTELFFTNAKRIINQEKYHFFFNCRGLSGMPTTGLHLNVSTLHISNVCSFLSGSSLPLAMVDNQIYDARLAEASFRALEQRINVLKANCHTCPLVGICAGGCVLNGLDSQNEINPAACAYQKEMWAGYLKKAYFDSLEPDDAPAEGS